MSVLIKGMKKPQNCMMCQFHGFGGYKNELIVCSLTGRSEGHRSNVRGCPLVEIPTPHGRLIDEEVLWDTLRYGYDVDLSELPETLAALLEMIDHQDTIIEAEEGEPDD